MTVEAVGGRQEAVGARGGRLLPTAYCLLPSRGFTLIEVLVVIALLALLAAFGVVLGREFHSSSALQTEAAVFAAGLRRASAAAVAGLNDSAHGVRVEPSPSNRWVVFQGATFVEGAAGNEVHAVPGPVTIASVALAGGGNDVVFTERRGTTASPGTVTFQTALSESVTIAVSAQGVIDVQ